MLLRAGSAQIINWIDATGLAGHQLATERFRRAGKEGPVHAASLRTVTEAVANGHGEDLPPPPRRRRAAARPARVALLLHVQLHLPLGHAAAGDRLPGDAFFNKAIRLTRDERLGPITSSAGRAFYARAVPLADPVSRRPASFATAFAFSIARRPTRPPPRATGSPSSSPRSPPRSPTAPRAASSASSTPPPPTPAPPSWPSSSTPTGTTGTPATTTSASISAGIVSAATADWPTSMKDGRRAHARVEYDADVTRNLTVALAYGDDRPAVLLWHAVDLRDYLPDSVAVGFLRRHGRGRRAAPGVVWFVKEWRKAGEQMVDGDIDIDDVMGGDYDELADEFVVVETGPRRFRYGELAAATRNFAEDRKLGQGGGSTQGRKEYAAEVRIISQLRHRHLVRLVGWCHDRRGDFLLVYEHMPNGSVDHPLYGKGKGGAPLAWPTRYGRRAGPRVGGALPP
ncbi:hypothetical protein PR202_gb04559 [Eleusine coracana subsp. coracana]|uniref:Protein kinase domain-containing protein n=1 Tax=Eleusine coracana subsp. coracana TaxID=191504 RepID=A0AAV5E2F1_ELECO|nr:hypothetical protein PR202_gb04559 [Eleusine coracana subsp. coracana]